MKISYFGHLPLVISMSALLVSCDQKVDQKVNRDEAEVSTADLAREARFSPWTSKAGLQLKMERLPGDQYFSAVQGRLKDGANQYRAISETFDGETYREWAVFWGLSESELFEHEIALLRSGFERRDHQVYTDSAGIAMHQLVMLRRVSALSSSPRIARAQENSDGDRRVTSAAIVPPAGGGETSMAPDFIKPELRPIDDAPVPTPDSSSSSKTDANTNGDAMVGLSSATSIANEINDAAPVEAIAATPVLPKLVEPPVVEVVEDPEPEPEAKPEPKVEPKVEAKPEPKEEKPKPESKKTHRVVRGDTLSSIARRYGVRISALKSANGLRTDIIRLRQVLKIPTR